MSKNSINIIDRIYIDIRYYFITGIIFKIDKRFKNLYTQIKKDPPKNYKSKLYIIAYYTSVNWADKRFKYKQNLNKIKSNIDTIK